MRTFPIVALAAAISFEVVLAQGLPKAEKFSPLGFYDLRAYEQAYPEPVASPQVAQAAARQYWAFQGIALRGSASPAPVWTSLGPLTTLLDPADLSKNISGRVAALAISPTCTLQGPCRMWVGTAGGGVWRTDDAMNLTDPAWRWVSHGLGTNSIGSVTVDPNDRTGDTIFVGTGETNSPVNSGAGTGLYRSIDAGDHWSRISTLIVDQSVSPGPIDFTFTRGISSVVIEPGNSQTIYVATTSAMLGMTAVRGGQTQSTGFPQPRVGLYKTDNGGTTWTLLWVPPLDPVIPPNPDLGTGVGDTMFGVRLVKLDPANPKIVYATAWNNAIHRSAPSIEGGDAAFKPVFAVVNLQRFQDLAMFDLTVKDGHTRVYAYNGTLNTADQSLYRLDNADVPASTLVTIQANGTLTNTGSWIKLSSPDPSQLGSTSQAICGSQCFYDLVVAVPANQPDTVFLGGVFVPTSGEDTIRSTDAGQSFSAFGHDGQSPRSSSHVDVRAIAFHPRNASIAFVGSDGGVVRNDGTFVDITSRCSQLLPNLRSSVCQAVLSAVPLHLYFLNKGLQTLQFYNVSVDPKAPLTRLLGGLQDNGTIWRDGTGTPGVWKSLGVGGDGTSASGFHPTRTGVLFASFQSNYFFTNFRDGNPSFWAFTAGRIQASGERATITQSTGRQFLTFDLVNSDTQFTGFQHVWRTQSNGGAQAALESACLTTTSASCGDWVPLGLPYPFQSGTTPGSTSRKPGDLTSDFYGADRAGGLIVAAERSAADAGTLWSATNFGRLFIAKNANGPAADVQFVRIDGGIMPNRFVTRIVADRNDPNVALISYSGFNVLTPATPGHVFRAVYNPTTQVATFTSLDFDLGDLPINSLAFDDARGDIYAATDFGPLLLSAGASQWQVAGVGFPEVLMVGFQLVADQRLLVAATHGLGIFYLNLPR